MKRSVSGSREIMRDAVVAFIENEEGSYVLETALVMPLFLTVIFLFISCALMLFLYGNITFASQAAVRQAAVCSLSSQAPCSTGDIQQAAVGAMLPTGGGIVSTSAKWSAGNVIGSTVTVTIQLTYPVVLPYLNMSSWTIEAVSTGTILH